MRARLARISILVGAIAVLALFLSGSGSSQIPTPTASCSPAPADCHAWHTSTVTLTWAAPPLGVTAVGCGSATISSDTSGTPISCKWQGQGDETSRTVYVRRDASPPPVSPSPERGPDANGWYNRSVSVTFSGSDPTSGISSCTSGSYGGPDKADVSLSGRCTNGAGLSASASYGLKYDATAPTVEAKPGREPNARGWYNRAIRISFVGTDAVSGIESCAAPVEYKGPDTEKTSLSGTCRDKAGNTSQPVGFEVKYDTKPPTLGRVEAEIKPNGVILTWTASNDSRSFAVVRRPGLNGPKPSTIYAGSGTRFWDRQLQLSAEYRYTVTAYDQAGNGAAKVLLAQPSLGKTTEATPAQPTPATAKPGLRTPGVDARVTAPPLLSWKRLPNATYYNVQLYRDGRKILTAWPKRPSLRLQESWTYQGRKYTLTPGRYRWYVWPGFGSLSANRYGKLLGSRIFVVTGS